MVELDEQACALAQRNIVRHDMNERVDVVLDANSACQADKPFDLIISNPPYVDAADMTSLPPEFQAEPGVPGGGR